MLNLIGMKISTILRSKILIIETYGILFFSATLICAWGDDGAAALTQGSSPVTSSIFPPESLLDTLGAGDTFNAATILALSTGKTVHEAITFGCRVAGAKCGALGYKHLNGMQKFL